MKECPFCKADLEENARFCLYCMASLDEKHIVYIKKKRRRIALAVILALLVAILGCSAYLIFYHPESEIPEDTATSEASSVIENSSSASTQENVASIGSEDSEDSEASEDSSAVLSDVVSDDINEPNPEKEYVFPPVHATSDDNIFYYREALPSDDYHGNTAITKDAVVITGVSRVAEGGVYIVPETICGKKVVAIMDNTFSSDEIRDTVKVIAVPESVKTIHAYAMLNCYNLTDIYLCGDSVGGNFLSNMYNLGYDYDLEGKITVHCSSECENREYSTIKSICEHVGANYDEWYNEK